MSNLCHVNDRGESGDDDDVKHDRVEKLWFYFVVALGFATGFWVFIGVLFLKKGWRRAYFEYIDEVVQKIDVTFGIQFARLKKRWTGNPVD